MSHVAWRWIAVALALILPLTTKAEPALRHYPATGPCPPLLILSHGFGGDETGLSDLAQGAAVAGFDTWVMGHALSGRAAIRAVLRADNRRAALAEAVADPTANRQRAADIAATLARAEAAAGCLPKPKVLGGHSMGAQTTMIEAGAQNSLGITGKDRFDAYIALSPQGLGDRFPPGAWAGLSKPMLLVTGTRDSAIEGGWQTRLAAFDGLPADGRKWLAIVAGANHREVSGRGAGSRPERARAVVIDFLTGLRLDAVGLPDRAGVEVRHK
ncbi:hypothetical protein [Pseudooceanicola sp.]|uniref:hypothetical protein n=1 Tax=Pseudooceanicola sp. TaxID=1914328 RepID=UPI00262750D9|nr:hypothetical protein [Pseudooceanicola sp.]MDF1855712.1 hypothetical protein [Pseudooceanicola sp.]